MTIQEIVLRSNIIVSLLPETYGDKVNLTPTLAPYEKEGYTVIDERREIKNLTAINYIQSLDQVEYPQIPATASDSEASLVLLNLQWLSPRVHLNTWVNDYLVDALSMLTPKPYPFSNVTLKDFSFDSSTIISVGIENVGFGFLTDNDKIVIIGDFNRYIYLEKTENIAIAFNNIATSLQAIATAISELEINITPPDDNDNGGGDDDGGNTGGGNDGNGDGDNNNGDNDFMPLAVKDSNYTITTNGERIACITNFGGFTVTLPANPVTGWEVEIIFLSGGVDSVQIDFNGKSILSIDSSGNATLDITEASLNSANRGGKLVYSDPYWEFYPNHGATNANANPPFNLVTI